MITTLDKSYQKVPIRKNQYPYILLRHLLQFKNSEKILYNYLIYKEFILGLQIGTLLVQQSYTLEAEPALVRIWLRKD